jgi:hypothetical protein
MGVKASTAFFSEVLLAVRLPWGSTAVKMPLDW